MELIVSNDHEIVITFIGDFQFSQQFLKDKYSELIKIRVERDLCYAKLVMKSILGLNFKCLVPTFLI